MNWEPINILIRNNLNLLSNLYLSPCGILSHPIQNLSSSLFQNAPFHLTNLTKDDALKIMKHKNFSSSLSSWTEMNINMIKNNLNAAFDPDHWMAGLAFFSAWSLETQVALDSICSKSLMLISTRDMSWTDGCWHIPWMLIVNKL